MAQETKIAIKLEEEAKPIKKMCEKLMDSINHELDKGIENVDTKELGEAIDMVKDLYEAKKEMYEACYYKQIMEAMEESEYGEEYDENGPMDSERRGYRGQPRSQSGRFMSRSDGRRNNRGRRSYDEMDYMMPIEWDDMEQMRDMDRNHGKMYYSGGGSIGSSGGQSSGGSSMSGGSSSSGGSMGSSRGYSDGGRNQQSSRSENARRGYEETKMMQDNSPEGKKKSMESLEHYMKELGEDISELIGKMDASEKTMLKNKLQALAQRVS